ncbi:hypothetical protein PHYBLDRAFT_169414 [Phycomyces blakesleeanus NRRL 1555(-)]|uniref:Uncharacterized protein n=1 Tax=Phycomyces blakesleeanus (strain ATCC 8743b / DSM 1359 / FGSC 10004 / NBRC 33097 / NRRL 1555) TaxID=763407 RepID=A0A162X302_PHYB8|nr:hypothetical protein PHYBLDRAFT_169414 [Phycomyces blakesleeanus NRRL 1555(-)]OAD72275.1 hypothetical protein PHYBLDRAFT_169414 [Phycomyces blakesleeanus NRRL 1555(-)]|eukprot:XP_018290315.1 hypothetical protein PHYBLDRAFT_169414 [Phycomyces blakesleeanus NRRL 1555(-)]
MKGFSVPSVRAEHHYLNECIDAMDRKLVVIQKPFLFGNSWLDRCSSASMALVAVYDYKKGNQKQYIYLQDYMCIIFGNSKKYLEELLRADETNPQRMRMRILRAYTETAFEGRAKHYEANNLHFASLSSLAIISLLRRSLLEICFLARTSSLALLSLDALFKRRASKNDTTKASFTYSNYELGEIKASSKISVSLSELLKNSDWNSSCVNLVFLVSDVNDDESDNDGAGIDTDADVEGRRNENWARKLGVGICDSIFLPDEYYWGCICLN